MEKGNRVQEIKKKFEGLNSQKNESCQSARTQLSTNYTDVCSRTNKKGQDGDCNVSVKGIIKRSHAFRSDKPKIKPFSQNTSSFGPGNLTGDKTFPKKIISSDCAAKKSSIELAKPCILKSNVFDKEINIRHLNASNSPEKSDNLSDTLKKVLRNPLPAGPAPKKPPRTFAHLGKSLELEDSLISKKNLLTNQLSDSGVARNNGSLGPSKNTLSLSGRSKTEPHIMLKKLESALLSNQLNNNFVTPTTKPSISPEPCNKNFNSIKSISSINKKKVLCLNGFSSCINGNIYDTPFEQAAIQSNGKSNVKLTSKTTTTPYGSIQKKVVSRHIYEEPYSPKSERKFDGIKWNEQTAKVSSSKPSVHYMSSPIRESKRITGHEAPLKLFPSSNIDEKIKMITDAFNENTRSDSDAESTQDERAGNHEEVTAVRKVYAKRVSSMRQQTPRATQGQNLFEALLLIGIDQDLKLGKLPYIKMKYPEMAHLPESLPELVFPDAGDWPPKTPNGRRLHNNYTIALTSSDGSRKYAYCRRLQPEGAPFCLPLAYVIISAHRDNTFYYLVLAELEIRHGVPEADSLQFIRSLYHSTLPKPGNSLKIGETLIRRATDSRQESYDISRILQGATVPVFIKILSTLLIERKVIIIGSNISVVSDCIEGLQKALFPFDWEHTLIGAVPSSRLELCTAPTPYLMGVVRPKENSQSANFLPLKSIDNCLVADVDNGEVLLSCGDEHSLLPSRLSSCLRAALYLCPVHGNDVGPSEALIRLFVELVGHYNNHVITDVHTNNRTFQRDEFVKAPRSRSVQMFLEWFTETAMFQSFIQRRLERPFEPGLFEQRCAEFIEENVKNHNISKKEKSLNMTVKIIDRFKDWTSSS